MTSTRKDRDAQASRSRMSRRQAVAAVMCAASSALAVPRDAAAQEAPRYEVTGFRDARFGMTDSEVRAIVVKAFGAKPADITSGTNDIEGTSVLTVALPSLDPGPGTARVAYIFGNKSKKLIQVNVVWGEGGAIEPNAMIAAGTRIERYFAGYSWKKDTLRAGVPVGENTIVLFAGEDEKAGAVRLIVDGVKYQMQRDGNKTTSPDPKGPPRLIINYIADRDNPDIAKIERGKF